MARSKSSKRWLAEYFEDPYVRRAQAEGWRSRSAFKLLELHQKFGLIRPGSTVVDLGCAPGGWCQVAKSLTGKKGRVIGVDMLPVEPLPGVEIIHGDFTEREVLETLERALRSTTVDLVLSDLAPNISGVDVADQARSMYLAELALDFCRNHLKPDGDFLVKVFQGEGFDAYLREVRTLFAKVTVRKPAASRPRSREVYLLARERRVG